MMNITTMKKLSLWILLMVCALYSHAQDFGVSFSYFVPKNGTFSTPISPFSFRGLGFDLNRFFAIETGGSLYRMSGLNIIDLPFESRDPLTGANFTLFVPVELVFQLRGNNVQFDIKGGVFGFHGFSQRLDYGNLDRAIRAYENWEVANSKFSFKNHPGWGYMTGVELTFGVTSTVGISIETNYLMGNSKFPLTGSYSGGTTTFETKAVEYPNAKVDLTGLEFSLGLIFSSNSGRPAPKGKKQKRRK
jgi:hypothetical protein